MMQLQKYIITENDSGRQWEVQADSPDMAVVATYFSTRSKKPLRVVGDLSRFTFVEHEEVERVFHAYVSKRISEDKDFFLDIINSVKPIKPIL